MISYQVHQFGAALARCEHPTPQPQGSEVLLRVLAAGVCHTDIHTWHGWYDMGGGRRLVMAERGVTLPLTLGHEIVGEVLAGGPHAPVVAGQRRLVYPWLGCGHCKVCVRGHEQLCLAPRFMGIHRAGGYASHVLVPHARYLIDIGEMAPEHAAPYACSGLTTFSAIGRFNRDVLQQESVVVIGAGGLGLMAVALLQALGGAGSIVIEPDPGRRQAALDGGAAAAFDPAEPGVAARVKAAAGGSVWAVLDCVGSGQTVQMALDLLVKGGQLVQVGLFGGQIDLPTPMLPVRSLGYQGVLVGSLPELRELMDLVKTGAVRPIPISCRCLHDAGAALQALEAGQNIGRLVLQPDVPPQPA